MNSGVAIPFVNLIAQHAAMKDELLEAVARVLAHGQFVLGPEVAEFEQRFAEMCGVAHAIGVGNGTDALVMALRALDIGDGDEVITPPNSFVATTAAIVLAGARPVFVDTGDDLNIDVAKIEAALTPYTRAILPVHLTGRPARMDALMRIAQTRGLAVVEDCAQAFGAEYDGRRVGSFGRIGCFSLHPLKTLNACGDGGVLTTDDAGLAERLRIMRNIGLKNRDECVEWSGNSRLDTLQAAILNVKLQYVEQWTEARRANAAMYRRLLTDVSQLVLPPERPPERPVYHTFVVQADRRDALAAYLRQRGIGTAVHYAVPIHRQPVAQPLGHAAASFPFTEAQASRILSLPVYPELAPADLERVAAGIRDFYAGIPA
jgi:dTDP-4-amino-4,6-dideoxygalactose transaminase